MSMMMKQRCLGVKVFKWKHNGCLDRVTVEKKWKSLKSMFIG